MAIVVALLTVVVFDEELWGGQSQIPFIAALAIAGILGWLAALTVRRSPHLDKPAEPLPQAEAYDERALLSFTRQLLAATSSDELCAVVDSQLPVLLQGRKVWMVWDARSHSARRAATGKMQHESVLTEDVQDWTTFALRLEDKRIGLLGVESAGGLGPDLRERIRSITPLIAQGLKASLEVDVFREASVLDLLTNTATRREGLNRLQAEVKRAQRTGTAMAVLMIDLDHFKSINDQYGHAVGDALLTGIGETLHRTLRASDIRCRWGGEEFLVVLPDTSLSRAQVVATHILHNIAATSVPTPKGPVSSTASLGLTISRPAEIDVMRIVARADMALYQAKNAGRSCVRVVLGGLEGQPVAAAGVRNEKPNSQGETLPFPDRRDPTRADRRSVVGPGRRKTDPPHPFQKPDNEPHDVQQGPKLAQRS